MKIFIVDDMEVNLELLEARLEGSGYEVTSAMNGVEALERLKRDSFDMIISDILMPKMDGFQLCRECKKDDTLRKIPFIFYTATYTDKKDEEFALSLGAERFIVKAIESKRFMEIIEGILKNYKNGLLAPSEIPVEEEDIYLKEYNERLINKLEKKMLDLESEITERKRAEERVEHLNNVLRAIRGVNQLIVKEKDRDRLIKGACDNIIKTRGYHSAWIALLDQSGGIVETADAGLGKDFLPMLKQLKRGEMPDCAQKALSQSEVVETKDPVSTCIYCPLSAQYSDTGAMTVHLEHEGKVYGLFCVSMPRDFLEDEEEQSLFKEVAGDIAFALHSIELEEERKQAEEALRESEEKFRELFDGSNDAIFIANPETRKLVDCNKQAQEITGYSRKEILSMRADQLHPKDKVKKTMEDFKKHATGELLLVESEVLTKDKKRVPVSISSALVEIAGEKYLQGVFRDISEHKQAEEALRESERKYRRIFENIQDVYYESSLDGTILEISPSIENVSQYKRKELIGRSVYDIYTNPEERDEFVKFILDKGKVNDFEISLTDKNGSQHPCSMTTLLVKDEQGNPIKFVGSIHDISERKQAEEEKKKLQTQLQQAQKMEAIGTLAGGIAHDFNNILTLIMGYTELTMMNLPEDSPFRDNMNKLFEAGERARDLVKQILTFSRQREKEKKPVQIHLIVKETLKLLRPTIPTTIEIHQNITSTGTVMADPTQIHQVIMNLCTNAYHAMSDKGGVLEVGLADVGLDSDFTARHLDTNPGPYLRITVSDTGHGMEKKVIDRIFEPYYTTKEKTGGTGMGLAVVHGIVKSHGGVITVYSKPGKGSTFNVFLPKIEAAEGVVEPKEIIPLPIGRERILLVDDEPFIVEIGKGMLEHLGYQVTTRTSSIEALEAFRAQPEKFDLVITDMTMPRMTGDKLAKELMRIRPNLPIILCTGFSELIDEHKAKAIGIREFVMKPIVQREMAEAVRKALDQPSTF